MPPQPLTNFSRLAIHTMTNKPWSLQQCIAHYTAAGIPAITVWRNVIDPIGAPTAAKLLRDSGLQVVSLARGGFFPAFQPAQRQAALDDNRHAIDHCATIGAPLLVLVCGAVPGLPLHDARSQIRDAIGQLLPYAQSHNVKLAIEPLHPMYAADRSAINTLAQARAICEYHKSPFLGIALDVYHTWWDPDLQSEIQLAAQQQTLLAYHISDWRPNTRDLLNDRGLMGQGCIPLKQIRSWIESAGFSGPHEVEIFSNELWASDQTLYLNQIKNAYLAHA